MRCMPATRTGPDQECFLGRSFARALLLCLCLQLACAQALAGSPEPKPLLLASAPANMPPLYVVTPDGHPTGFAVEVLRQLAARAGYQLHLSTTAEPEESQRLLERGQVHVVPGLGVSEERSKRFAFTRPFETQSVHIYYRAQGPAREDQASLHGLRVSFVVGSIPLERLGTDPDFIARPALSLPQALFDLFSGETDALIFQAPLVEHAARTAGLENKLGRSKRPLFEVSRAFAVRRDRPDILARLDNALAEYRETPEFRLLYREWHVDPPPPLFPPATLWLMAVLLATLGGGMIVWRYVSLWRMNRKLLAVLAERDQALAALRLTQDRMEALFTLSHMNSADTAELIRFALAEGVRLTGSEMGFLLFVEGENIDLSRVHWSASVGSFAFMPQNQVYSMSEAGLWARCLHTKVPQVVNDYAASPDRRKLPEGHAAIRRFMAVPLVEAGEVVAIFGMANKAAPFDANDTRQLQLFLMGLWRVLGARRDAEAIRQAKDYAESLIQGANAMLVGLDTEGRITLFNAAAEAITGFTRDEVLGRDWGAAMLPGHLAASSAAHYHDFIAGRTALPRQHVGLLRTKAGQERHISWQNSLLKQGDAVTGIIAFGIDITEQKQAEAELRRLHRAIEQTAEGVLIADESGSILYANPAFERMTGMAAGAEVKSVFDLEVAVLEHQSTFSQGDGPEGTWRGACGFVRPDGVAAEVEFAVSATRSRADRLMSYVAVCREVTEKRLLEHQLWQAQKMEALGTLAGGIAHDFNNLLASIMGFTELAQDDLPKDSRSWSCLQRVLGASLRARELVRQILSFSRRNEHKLRHLRADAVVAEALTLLGASVAKNIEIQADLQAGVTILADPSQIHQIVMNLCTNAAQAMRDQGGRLLVRTGAGPLPVELAARHRLPPGEYLTLLVEDQGPGISPDVLARIFDPFFTTKAPGEGTGLGLAVVHGIVISLGGAVWAESETGQGARFQVLLPSRGNAEDIAGEAQAGELRGNERILLVDDEPDILEFCRQALTPLGYQVTVESDPEAALRLLLATPLAFDLLITDLNMPQITGVQLAEGLRPVHRHLPIVLITGSSRPIPPGRLETLGAVQLLLKPFSTSELALAVRQALATGGEQ